MLFIIVWYLIFVTHINKMENALLNVLKNPIIMSPPLVSFYVHYYDKHNTILSTRIDGIIMSAPPVSILFSSFLSGKLHKPLLHKHNSPDNLPTVSNASVGDILYIDDSTSSVMSSHPCFPNFPILYSSSVDIHLWCFMLRIPDLPLSKIKQIHI